MCPSEHNEMCPSEHELCVLPNMKLELRNKGSPLQLAPKPTHTQRANIMGPKAPNMRVVVIIQVRSEFKFTAKIILSDPFFRWQFLAPSSATRWYFVKFSYKTGY
jgi:hypothetical protein